MKARTLRRTVLIAMLALGGGAAAAEDPFEDAVDVYARMDFASALKLFRPLATQGDARAQTMLGYMYDKGQGVPQDYREAVTWYRRAAALGYPSAQSFLGALYANGSGVQQDDIRAHMWFDLAVASSEGAAGKRAADERGKLAATMTARQIADAQAMARKCQDSNFKQCD